MVRNILYNCSFNIVCIKPDNNGKLEFSESAGRVWKKPLLFGKTGAMAINRRNGICIYG